VNDSYIWECRSGILNCTCLCQGLTGGLTQKERDFYYLQRVQTASEAHPASCLMGAGGGEGQESNHSPLCNAEIKNE